MVQCRFMYQRSSPQTYLLDTCINFYENEEYFYCLLASLSFSLSVLFLVNQPTLSRLCQFGIRAHLEQWLTKLCYKNMRNQSLEGKMDLVHVSKECADQKTMCENQGQI